MPSLSIVLALIAAVSAIDIHGHLESHCGDGAQVIWRDVEPDRCTANGGVYNALSFNYIPKEWQLATRTYTDANCSPYRLYFEFNSDGREWLCHGDKSNKGSYRSAAYNFIGKKRAVVDGVEARECQKPDLLALEDGQMYSIAGVEDDLVQEMVGRSSGQ